jgi:hypothetical protein
MPRPLRFARCSRAPRSLRSVGPGLSALLLLAATLTACGAGFTVRDGGSGGRSGDGATDTSQAILPARGRTIDAAGAWEAGDSAFRAGDPVTAQRHFGLVYIADPGFNGGQIGAALTETCRAVGNDCPLVMGRLDLLRIEYAELYGPRDGWVAEQERDYGRILSCYDAGLVGRWDAAYEAGVAAANAPLPAFSQLARLCLDRVQALGGQERAAQAQRDASAQWPSVSAPFFESWAQLDAAISADDWDAIVDTYPRYKVDEEPVARIVAAGFLAGHPEHAEDVAWAADAIEQVARWEADNLATYDEMRDAVRRLEEDDAYFEALLAYESAYQPVAQLEEEVRSLELARDATTGDARRAIDRRIEAKEAEIRDARRDLRRLMVPINRRREAAGLPEREAPYGLE